jgi:hypothetical protein
MNDLEIHTIRLSVEDGNRLETLAASLDTSADEVAHLAIDVLWEIAADPEFAARCVRARDELNAERWAEAERKAAVN